MALLGRENIAMPDSAKGQLIYKWPDMHIRRYSHCIVEGDYAAMFTLQGEIKGIIDQPGRWPLDAQELPFIGIFQDHLIGEGRYRSELYYVSKRELLEKFGGPVDGVRDPESRIPVRLFVYGEYLVKIADPQSLIFKFSGTVDQPDNRAITGLSDEFVLTALKQLVTQKVMTKEWEVFGISAYTPQIQQSVVGVANAGFDGTGGGSRDYGLEITRLPSFNISLDDESQAKLDEYYTQQSKITMAANADPAAMQRAAAYQMSMGASKGLETGAANTPAFLGMGMNMGQMTGGFQQPQPQQGGGAPPPQQAAAPAAAPGIACPSCGTQNPQGARFCANCGTSLAPKTATCAGCGTELPAGAKFCPSCGRQQDGQG